MERDDLTLRPITGPAELGLFNQLLYVLNAELADDLADGRRRPEWMWLALRGGRPLARAAPPRLVTSQALFWLLNGQQRLASGRLATTSSAAP